MNDNPVFNENQETYEVVLKRFYQIRDEYSRPGTGNREEEWNGASTFCRLICLAQRQRKRRTILGPKVNKL